MNFNLGLEPCRPPIWARDGHTQTILGHFLPSPPLARGGRAFTIELPDGDRLAAVAFEGSREAKIALCVFHGLGGDAEADYMRRTAALGLARGWPVILANHRGCGAGAGLARLPYHSGRAEDLAAVLRHSRLLHPGLRQLAVGFSLSGNALLLLLGGLRGDTLPELAIAVNSPINLEKTSHALHRGLNRAYELRFVLNCRRQIPDRASYPISARHSLRDFDARYTAPASGFASRDEYYRLCSSKQALPRIQVPTVVLSSRDDPFVDHSDYLSASLSPAVHLHLEKHGGHMGYLTSARTPLGTHRWLDYALAKAFDALVAT